MASVQTVLVCTVATETPSAVEAQLCPADATNPGGYNVTTVSAYVFAASDAPAVQAAVGPFDYTQAVGFFTLAFGVVVSVWLVSRACGAILEMIKSS